jgi:hypothetical protein
MGEKGRELVIKDLGDGGDKRLVCKNVGKGINLTLSKLYNNLERSEKYIGGDYVHTVRATEEA